MGTSFGKENTDERNDVTGTDRSPLSGRNTSSTPTQSKPKDESVSVTDERKGQNKPKTQSSRGKSDKEKIRLDKKHSTHSQQPSSSFYVDVDSGDNRGAEKKLNVRNTSKQHQQQITGKCMPGPEVESNYFFNLVPRKKPKGSASESISSYDTGHMIKKGMITQSRYKENSSQLGSKKDGIYRNIVATPSQTTPCSYSNAVKGIRFYTPNATKANEESSGEIIVTDFNADEPVTFKQQKHTTTLQSLSKNDFIEIPEDLRDLINSMTVDTPTENVQPKDIHKFPPVSADDSQLPATYPPHPIMRSSSYDNSSVHHSRESCIQNSFRPSFAEDSNSATKKGAKEAIQIQENTRYHTRPVEYPHCSTPEIVSDLMETAPLATKEFSKDQPTNIVKSDFYKNLLKLNSTNGPIDTASIIKADGSYDHLRNPLITNIMPNEPQSYCLEHPNKPQEVFNKTYSPLINEISLLPTPMISHQNSDQLLDFADVGQKSAPFLLRNDLIDDYRTSSKSSNKERSTNEKPFVSTLQNYQNPETSGVEENSVSFVSSRKDNTPSIEDCKGHREIAEIEEQTEDLKPQLDETSDFTNKEAVSVTPSPLASAAPVKLDQKPPDKLEAQELLIEATNSGMENKYLVRTQKSIQQITKDNDGDDVTGDLIKCETHTAVGFQRETENDDVERLAIGESDHLLHQKILYESNVLVNNETSIPALQEIIQNRGDSEEHNSHQTSSAHDEADEEHDGRIFSSTDAINNGSTASINESTVFSTDNARYINEKYVGQVMNETYEPPETSHIDCNRPVTEMSSFVHDNDNVDQIPSSLEHQSNEQNSQFYFGQFTNKEPTFSKTSKENEDKAYSGEDKNVFQKEIEVKAQQEELDGDFVVVSPIPKSAIDANNSEVEDTFSIKSEPSSQQIEKDNEAVKSAEGFLKNESHVESGFQEERESSGIEISTNIVSSTQEKRVDDANQRKQKVVESVSHPLESVIQDILSGKSEGPRTQIMNKVAEFLGQSKDDSFVLKKESKIVEINTSVLKNENAFTLTSDGDSNLSPHPGATKFPFYSESMTKKNAEEINLDKNNAIGDNVEVITKEQPATEMQDTKIIDRYKYSPKNESFSMEKIAPAEFRADTDNKSDPSEKANHVNQAMQLSEKQLHNEVNILPSETIDGSGSSINREQTTSLTAQIEQNEECEGWTDEQEQIVDTLKQININKKVKPLEAGIAKITELDENYYTEGSLQTLKDKLDDLYDAVGENDQLRGQIKEIYNYMFPLFGRLNDQVDENWSTKQDANSKSFNLWRRKSQCRPNLQHPSSNFNLAANPGVSSDPENKLNLHSASKQPQQQITGKSRCYPDIEDQRTHSFTKPVGNSKKVLNSSNLLHRKSQCRPNSQQPSSSCNLAANPGVSSVPEKKLSSYRESKQPQQKITGKSRSYPDIENQRTNSFTKPVGNSKKVLNSSNLLHRKSQCRPNSQQPSSSCNLAANPGVSSVPEKKLSSYRESKQPQQKITGKSRSYPDIENQRTNSFTKPVGNSKKVLNSSNLLHRKSQCRPNSQQPSSSCNLAANPGVSSVPGKKISSYRESKQPQQKITGKSNRYPDIENQRINSFTKQDGNSKKVPNSLNFSERKSESIPNSASNLALVSPQRMSSKHKAEHLSQLENEKEEPLFGTQNYENIVTTIETKPTSHSNAVKSIRFDTSKATKMNEEPNRKEPKAGVSVTLEQPKHETTLQSFLKIENLNSSEILKKGGDLINGMTVDPGILSVQPGGIHRFASVLRFDTPKATKTNEKSTSKKIVTDFNADEPVTLQQPKHEISQSVLKNENLHFSEILQDGGDLINSMSVETPFGDVQPGDIPKFPPN